MISTLDWAKSLDISVDDIPPPLEGVTHSIPYTAREIGIRAVILQGVVAVAAQVDPEPVIAWFQEQGIWEQVSPREKLFLLLPSRSGDECIDYYWHVEAEWTLLWAINKVEALGLPIQTCDTRRLVDEIIPALWSDIDQFLASAELRHPDILLAEDFRTYDLWCAAQPARRKNELPDDLDWSVLYERRYAFEWLDGLEPWDEITCDA
jgi:hypothetical protein